MRLLVLLSFALTAQPVKTVWVRSTTSLDVQSVETTGTAVIVRSNGLSLAQLGPLGTPPVPPPAPRQFTFRIPTAPKAASGPHAHVPIDYAGVFVNGVPIYNQFEATSYRGQNIWHYDPLARQAATGLIAGLLPGTGRHSPIIGFALDGYPVYGPWSEFGKLRSSYQLRPLTVRDRLPDGTLLAPGQTGPPVTPEHPLGTFVEDYEYVPGSGGLDRYNGRFVKTPEYPEGTYAYFLSTGPAGQLAFPYLFAHEFYGEFTRPAGTESKLRFHVNDAGGKPIRHLEFVHERPMHVLVISQDRQSFAHIHPEVDEYGTWSVPYTFPHKGRFRVYSDYSAPGANQRIEWYDVDAGGPPRPANAPVTKPPVTLVTEGGIHAGEDTELQFRIDEKVVGWQRFLGAWAHLVIAGEGLSSLQHAHPLEALSDLDAHTHLSGPPPDLLRVPVNFAQSGQYKLWFQIQQNGTVETIPFTLPVAASRGKVIRQPAPAGAIPLRITAHGYEPMRLSIPAGRPLQLAVTRTGESNCGSKLVFPALGLTSDIAPGATTIVDLPAQQPGELRFTCGMGMYRGSIVAVNAAVSPAPQKTDSASETPVLHTPE